MRKTNKKGFTIVELVIVVAVIAILAAVLIPTFAGIIKSANESVDMQIVASMNKALYTDEIINGKPATVVQAQEILIANGCDDFTPADANNVYYWVGAENKVILWTKNADNPETGKVTYPDDMAKKYSDVSIASADWSDLKLEYNYVEVEVTEGEDVKAALITAIKEAEDDAILKLPANSELSMKQGGMYWLGEAIKMDGGTGKSVTIDLNGSTIVSSGSNAVFTRTEDGTGWQKDDNGDYVYNILTVPANGELILANGNIEIDHGNQPAMASVMAESGSKLVLRDVNISTTTAGILPAGDASEVVIENSTISAANYALGTNRMESSNIRMTISNSKLSATGATAVLINTPSDNHIYNSTITGIVHAVVLRAGYLEIKDSTLITTDTEPGIYAYDNFAKGYNFQGWWHDGNTMPAAALVVGDYAKANGDGSFSYAGNAVVEMTNTKIQSADANAVPTILLSASDPAKTVSVTYDEASVVGTPVVYGSVWNGTDDNVGVTFSHPGTIKVNGETKN